MPAKRKPARLWFRKDTGTWFIKDGDRRIGTECTESEIGRAQERLAAYIAGQYQPVRGGHPSEVTVADVLLVYDEDKADSTSRPKETRAAIGRLNDFFGAMTLSEIKGRTCREFADERETESGARRDLEVLRAAINHYHREHQLDIVPAITLPAKSLPRDTWLTRQEVAKLIRAARKHNHHSHIIRLIMIGLYTGTRLSALLSLQWIPSTTGGHIDIERGVIYRKAIGERVAHNKRKPPVKIPPRLLRFLRHWKAADTAMSQVDEKPIALRYAIHFGGRKIIKPHKAFRAVRAAAGLDDHVTPHLLRHTRATWLAQAGVDPHQAAASLGMTVEEFERTYAHVSPDFQDQAANAF